MDTPKTLAARPGMKTAPLYHYDDGDAGHRCGTMMCGFCGKPIVDTAFRWRQRNNGDFVTHHRSCTEADPGWAKHDADRLLAPDVGVGLTRYRMWVRIDWNVDPDVDPEGEWVRHEDVAPLLAAARAAPADVKLEASVLAGQIMAIAGRRSEPSLEPGIDPTRDRIAALIEAHTLAASTARTEAENAEHNRWMEQVIAERDEARAEVAASTAREKAKDEETERLRSIEAESHEGQDIIREQAEEIAALREALMGAKDAVNAAYRQAEAEYAGHDLRAAKYDKTLRDWRKQRDAALSGRKPDTKEGT